MSAPNTSLPFPVMDAAPGQDPWARPQRDPMAKQAGTGTGKREPSVKPCPSPLQCHRPSPAGAQPSAEAAASRVPLAQLRPRKEQGMPTLSRGPGDTLSPCAQATSGVPRPSRGPPGLPGPHRPLSPRMPGKAPSRPWAAAPRVPVAAWRVGRCGGRRTHRGGRCGAVWGGRAVSPWRQRSSDQPSTPLSGCARRGGRHLNRGGVACPPAGRPLAENTQGEGRGTAPTDAPPPHTWGPLGAAPRGPPGAPEPRGHPGPLGPWSHRDGRDPGATCSPGTFRTSQSQGPPGPPGPLGP